MSNSDKAIDETLHRVNIAGLIRYRNNLTKIVYSLREELPDWVCAQKAVVELDLVLRNIQRDIEYQGAKLEIIIKHRN